jgi:hypothetical protein
MDGHKCSYFWNISRLLVLRIVENTGSIFMECIDKRCVKHGGLFQMRLDDMLGR